jgi:tRNA threonylcarbamoyladenosine biosynthesis protein TsaE
MTVLKKIFFCADEKQQVAFGKALATACDHKSSVIFLQGDLGAGKTTLVRGFLQQMGFYDKVKSPTYSLIETYHINAKQILHVDLYRITSSDEVHALGLRDLFDDNTIGLIEWPERAKEQLPPADLACYIAPFADGRQIQLVTATLRGKEIVNSMVWA